MNAESVFSNLIIFTAAILFAIFSTVIALSDSQSLTASDLTQVNGMVVSGGIIYQRNSHYIYQLNLSGDQRDFRIELASNNKDKVADALSMPSSELVMLVETKSLWLRPSKKISWVYSLKVDGSDLISLEEKNAKRKRNGLWAWALAAFSIALAAYSLFKAYQLRGREKL